MPSTDSEENQDPAAKALLELEEAVGKLVSHRNEFEQKARGWVASESFQEVYDDLHPAWWFKMVVSLFGKGGLIKIDSAKLRAGYRKLAAEGELLFAGTVIGNSGMSGIAGFRYPAAVVASRVQDVPSIIRVALLGNEIAEIYLGKSDSSMPKCARIIADDNYQPLRRRLLPNDETDGLNAALFDIRVSAEELVAANEYGFLLPLLVLPGGGPFAVVPWYVLKDQPKPGQNGKPPPLPSRPPPLPGNNQNSIRSEEAENIHDKRERILRELRDRPQVACDFTTPEGAVRCLEVAYTNRDIEAAIEAHDFEFNARMQWQRINSSLGINTTPPAEVIRPLVDAEVARFRESTPLMWANFDGAESLFAGHEPYEPGVVVVNEVIVPATGSPASVRILVAETQHGWRVLHALNA